MNAPVAFALNSPSNTPKQDEEKRGNPLGHSNSLILLHYLHNNYCIRHFPKRRWPNNKRVLAGITPESFNVGLRSRGTPTDTHNHRRGLKPTQTLQASTTVWNQKRRQPHQQTERRDHCTRKSIKLFFFLTRFQDFSCGVPFSFGRSDDPEAEPLLTSGAFRGLGSILIHYEPSFRSREASRTARFFFFLLILYEAFFDTLHTVCSCS